MENIPRDNYPKFLSKLSNFEISKNLLYWGNPTEIPPKWTICRFKFLGNPAEKRDEHTIIQSDQQKNKSKINQINLRTGKPTDRKVILKNLESLYYGTKYFLFLLRLYLTHKL